MVFYGFIMVLKFYGFLIVYKMLTILSVVDLDDHLHNCNKH